MVKTEREMYLTGNELSSALKMADSKSWYGTCHRIRARNSLELIWEIYVKNEKLRAINKYVVETIGRRWNCLGEASKMRRGARIEPFKEWVEEKAKGRASHK